MKSRLALGTAQFGLNYGINNARGKISREEVGTILSAAFCHGIDTLDTAAAYGESEQVLGTLEDSRHFRIVSKYPATAVESDPWVVWAGSERSLRRPLYGYLLHNYQSFRRHLHLVDFLQELRRLVKVTRTGFSLYTPDELEEILKLDLPFELVQLPFNILDRRFLPYFDTLQRRGVEIHCRSVFLQGLVFRDPETLPDFFRPAFACLRLLRERASAMGISVAGFCLGFCLAHKILDKVVIGVDGLDNLNENLLAEQQASILDLDVSDFDDLELDNPRLINPALWRL